MYAENEAEKAVDYLTVFFCVIDVFTVVCIYVLCVYVA